MLWVSSGWRSWKQMTSYFRTRNSSPNKRSSAPNINRDPDLEVINKLLSRGQCNAFCITTDFPGRICPHIYSSATEALQVPHPHPLPALQGRASYWSHPRTLNALPSFLQLPADVMWQSPASPWKTHQRNGPSSGISSFALGTPQVHIFPPPLCLQANCSWLTPLND